jgi:hypothetical protein
MPPKIEAHIEVAANSVGFAVDAGAQAYIAAGIYSWESVGPTAAASLRAALQTLLAAAVASSTVTIADATGLLTITFGSGTHSLTFANTATRDLLGFTSNIPGGGGTAAAATGTRQVKGMWLPPVGAHGQLASYLSVGRRKSDRIVTAARSGAVYTSVANEYREQRLIFKGLTKAKRFVADEATVNESFEQLWLDYLKTGAGFRYYLDRTDDTSYQAEDGDRDYVLMAAPNDSRIGAGSDVLWTTELELLEYVAP